MLKKIGTRIKNKKVLIAVISGILLILVNLGIIGQDMSNEIMNTVNSVLGVLVAVGIFGNPESHVK
jgi:uncharacterized membrane protein